MLKHGSTRGKMIRLNAQFGLELIPDIIGMNIMEVWLKSSNDSNRSEGKIRQENLPVKK